MHFAKVRSTDLSHPALYGIGVTTTLGLLMVNTVGQALVVVWALHRVPAGPLPALPAAAAFTVGAICSGLGVYQLAHRLADHIEYHGRLRASLVHWEDGTITPRDELLAIRCPDDPRDLLDT